MEFIEKWLSIIGAIASIVGAWWAFYEAKKATKAASEAEIVRNEIIERRKIIELSQVHNETNRILNIVSKVGPSCNEEVLREINCADIAKQVEEYSRLLNEQSSHFSSLFENEAKKLCTNLNEDIEALSEAKSFNEKKQAGKSIYYKINRFLPTVKTLTDNINSKL